MRLKHPDLVAIAAIALANVVWAFLPFRLPIIGTILALPLVFIAPGYTVTGALFRRRSLDGAYRLLLSLGISISIVIAGGLLLNALPIGLRPTSWSMLLAFLTLLFSALAAYLQRKTPSPALHSTPIPGIAPTPDPTSAPGIASTPRPASFRLAWHGWIVCALAVLVVAFSIVFSASSVAQQPHAGFTQFWMLPSNQPGAACTVRLGIQSYELTSETYHIVVTANGNEESVWPSIQLTPRQQWNRSISINTIHSGPLYIEARLYLANHPQVVYREVHVTIYQCLFRLDKYDQLNPIAVCVSSCRDRGMRGGRVGALCLSFVAACFVRGILRPTNHICTKDRHKAPTLPPRIPLSLQRRGEGCHFSPI